MLTQSEFNVLQVICDNQCASFDGCAVSNVDTSEDSFAEICTKLQMNGYLDKGKITDKGKDFLDARRVRSAVILAAGEGSRLAPLSFERPKAMFEVRGEVLIERLIRQLREAGIERIAVVVGYMKSSFFYLHEKFDVEIVVNEDYASKGNYVSLLRARDFLKSGAYVCSSDQYYSNNPFKSREYESVLYLDRRAARSNDYAVHWNLKGEVISFSRDKGDEWCMRGPAYFDARTASALIEALDEERSSGDLGAAYWEDVFVNHEKEFEYHIDLMPKGVLREFNSISDLCVFDTDFLSNVDSGILDNICLTLGCERSEITRVRPVKAGLTNLSVLFTCKGVQYVYRHPGAGTDEVVNREAEECSLRIAKHLGLDETYVYEDPRQGWKISRYLPGCVEFDYRSPDHVSRALSLMRTLHGSGEVSPWYFDFYNEACRLKGLLEERGYPFPNDFEVLSKSIDHLALYVRADAGKPVLCHNDFYGPNLLVREDEMYLIDWEYSAMGDYASDVGNFIAQDSGYTIEEALLVVDEYFGGNATEQQHLHCLGYTAIVGYYWYVWALYKESLGNAMGDWTYAWYRSAKDFSAYALSSYREEEEASRPLSEAEFERLSEKAIDGTASPMELRRLGPYKVKRAVFFAAGFGSRMFPITVNTPKPLVRVHGVRIIDRLLDAVIAAGIEEIYVVRGYLAEEFDQLRRKYPSIRFIENPLYAETNNISSALAAKGLFENAYVFESDLYLTNSALVTPYQYRSNYLAIPVEQTDDWCFDSDEQGRIVALSKGNDRPCWKMVGLSYWNECDGRKLADDIGSVFNENEENKQLFWDDVPLRCRADRYDVRVRSCEESDVMEIDSFAELQDIDEAYRNR